jgi:hypothetical protein
LPTTGGALLMAIGAAPAGGDMVAITTSISILSIII